MRVFRITIVNRISGEKALERPRERTGCVLVSLWPLAHVDAHLFSFCDRLYYTDT